MDAVISGPVDGTNRRLKLCKLSSCGSDDDISEIMTVSSELTRYTIGWTDASFARRG